MAIPIEFSHDSGRQNLFSPRYYPPHGLVKRFHDRVPERRARDAAGLFLARRRGLAIAVRCDRGAAEKMTAALLLGVEHRSELDLALAVREGLPAGTIEAFAERSGLTREEIARVLDLANGSLPGDKLSEGQSDRLVRLAEVLSQAADVLGDLKSGVAWLRRAHIELGDRAPLELLSNEQGGLQLGRSSCGQRMGSRFNVGGVE